jgi:haloacid dehalogenase-like hydrolase
VTSGRPPRGMKMVVEQVNLSAPIAAFNGGTFVEPDTMKVLNSRRLDNEMAKALIDRIGSFDLDVWVYDDVSSRAGARTCCSSTDFRTRLRSGATKLQRWLLQATGSLHQNSAVSA